MGRSVGGSVRGTSGWISGRGSSGWISGWGSNGWTSDLEQNPCGPTLSQQLLVSGIAECMHIH